MSIKDFQLISKLGEGAYSSVYRVRRLEDHLEYALKKVKLQNLSDKEKQNALNEVRILASIHHQNIISYKEAFIDITSNSLCIVMEFADNGDIYQKISSTSKSNTYFKESEIWSFVIQVVRGLKALHDLKIFHRDLKSANVFMCQNGDIKLGDMNVSKVAKKGLLYTQTGTPYYASPEVWKDQPYDQKSDIWSLGCVVYEMAALKPPFRAEDMEGLYKKVIRGYYPRIPAQYSQELNNLIRSMLQVQPHLRPTCDKILMLPSTLKKTEDMNQQFFNTDDEPQTLLSTIKFPKNFNYLTSILPKPNYTPRKYSVKDSEDTVQQLVQVRKKHIKSLHSQQASPNPRSMHLHSAIGINDELNSISQQSIEKKEYSLLLNKKRPARSIDHSTNPNNADHYMINQILESYNKKEPLKLQQSKPLMKIRPNRHSSQDEVYVMDAISQHQSKISLDNSKLPILDELSPNKRRNRPPKQGRNQSLPNTNILPTILGHQIKQR